MEEGGKGGGDGGRSSGIQARDAPFIFFPLHSRYFCSVARVFADSRRKCYSRCFRRYPRQSPLFSLSAEKERINVENPKHVQRVDDESSAFLSFSFFIIARRYIRAHGELNSSIITPIADAVQLKSWITIQRYKENFPTPPSPSPSPSLSLSHSPRSLPRRIMRYLPSIHRAVYSTLQASY